MLLQTTGVLASVLLGPDAYKVSNDRDCAAAEMFFPLTKFRERSKWNDRLVTVPIGLSRTIPNRPKLNATAIDNQRARFICYGGNTYSKTRPTCHALPEGVPSSPSPRRTNPHACADARRRPGKVLDAVSGPPKYIIQSTGPVGKRLNPCLPDGSNPDPVRPKSLLELPLAVLNLVDGMNPRLPNSRISRRSRREGATVTAPPCFPPSSLPLSLSSHLKAQASCASGPDRARRPTISAVLRPPCPPRRRRRRSGSRRPISRMAAAPAPWRGCVLLVGHGQRVGGCSPAAPTPTRPTPRARRTAASSRPRGDVVWYLCQNQPRVDGGSCRAAPRAAPPASRPPGRSANLSRSPSLRGWPCGRRRMVRYRE